MGIADRLGSAVASGGLQEEAPGLGKPGLVLRETTERPEGVAAGTDAETIVCATQRL